jgi:berberine-like enzyme
VGTVEVRHWGGAMARPAADAGPVGHRDVPLSVVLDAHVPEVAAAVGPHATGGSFRNFLADPARARTAYTAADYEALREVKAAYDPDELLCIGHGIPPADAMFSRRSARRSRAASA